MVATIGVTRPTGLSGRAIGIMKNCKNCSQAFEIRDTDHAFYAKMDLSEPTLCPSCAMQRRYAWRNERKLYNRKCDLCSKKIISCFFDPKLTVYCRECWWGDKWDRDAYGREFDFNRPFFEQFAELQKAFPHFQLFQEGTSENCEYTNYGFGNKSCYMALCAWSENVYYGWAALRSRDGIDLTKVDECTECYECIDCFRSTRLLFSKNCYQCHDSAFLINCTNAQNCFGSINLNHKQYVFLGKQLTKEQYEAKMATIKFDNQKVEEMRSYMKAFSEKSIHRAYIGVNNSNSSGNYLDNTENCYQCYDTLQAKDCAYCDFAGGGAQDIWSCSNGGIGSNLVYESMGFSAMNNVAFLLYGRECSDSFYNQYCFSSNHLFGCIGLSRKEYRIFNKQYSREGYEALVPKIIQHMKKGNEWGDFFPAALSPYGYNETIAQDYFPLTKEQVIQKGWKWKEEAHVAKNEETETVKICKKCQHTFQLIEQELLFYKRFSLPHPDHCPECRHQRRVNQRNPRKLFDRTCAKCTAPIQTTYSPDRPETIYCEECYLKEVY